MEKIAFEDEDDDECEDDYRADASPGSWILTPDSSRPSVMVPVLKQVIENQA